MPDIFDFFKENESKLHEPPPEQLWQQLESRLEKRRRPRRVREIRFLQPWAVALILLILILAAVMVWHYTRNVK
jgi:fatty acid desaturase